MNPLIKVVVAACDDIGSPIAATVKQLLATRDWTKLSQLSVNPSDYDEAERYWEDTFVVDLLRKCELPSDIDREKLARETFLQCEQQNAQTNARLARYLPESFFIDSEVDWHVSQFIDCWRKEIAWVVGYLPADLHPRFSAGSTYADVGKLITIPDKMSSVPTLYAESRSVILPLWDGTSWERCVTQRYSKPANVRGNIFFTVPKDAKSVRGCCKEASLNVAYQLDAGRVLRARLRRIGIDLQSGQDVHRLLAQKASVDGSLATIDMSNASDTLCRVLPELVLPRIWFELLNSLRASRTRVDGKWFRLEKFSSMGNGFTFELETLIFATLARTVVSSEGGNPDAVSCYGDDLIVPTTHAKSVVAALRLFGFTPNSKKTFLEGSFRESCGGDYFRGIPVRGHFLKTVPDEPQEWIALANGLRRSCAGLPARWTKVRRSWHKCLDQIPAQIRRCRGPESLGDLVIHDEPPYWWTLPLRKEESSWDVVAIKVYAPVPQRLSWAHWRPEVQLASCTLGLESLGVTPRGGVSGFKLSRRLVCPPDA